MQWNIPPDCFHVLSTTGWFVSDLWPSLPLLFIGGSVQKQRQQREKKELLLRKLQAPETETSFVKLLTCTPTLLSTVQTFSLRPAHTLGLCSRTTMKFLVFLQPPAYFWQMHTREHSWQQRAVWSLPAHTHTHSQPVVRSKHKEQEFLSISNQMSKVLTFYTREII